MSSLKTKAGETLFEGELWAVGHSMGDEQPESGGQRFIASSSSHAQWALRAARFCKGEHPTTGRKIGHPLDLIDSIVDPNDPDAHIAEAMLYEMIHALYDDPRGGLPHELLQGRMHG